MRALLILMASLVIACSSAPKPFIPVAVSASIATDKKLNPDMRGRSSPVVVRVYELKDGAGFQGADFFSLYEREQATLGPDLIYREEYVMKPGETRLWNRKASVDARALGVLVAYRNLERSTWRTAVPLPVAKEEAGLWGKGILEIFAGVPTVRYSISVGENRVQVVPVSGR